MGQTRFLLVRGFASKTKVSFASRTNIDCKKKKFRAWSPFSFFLKKGNLFLSKLIPSLLLK
tara:strand:- start:1180 stop:1362 length:183 start_codon:yes stop_codon:yes gene_type:complete